MLSHDKPSAIHSWHDFMACYTSIRWSFKSIHCFFLLHLTVILPFCVISWIFSNPIFARAQPPVQLPVLLVWLICGQSLVSHWCAPMMQSNRGGEWRSLWLALNTLQYEGGCLGAPSSVLKKFSSNSIQKEKKKRFKGNAFVLFLINCILKKYIYVLILEIHKSYKVAWWFKQQ